MFLMEAEELLEDQMTIAAFVLALGVLCGDLQPRGLRVVVVMTQWPVGKASEVQALGRLIWVLWKASV